MKWREVKKDWTRTNYTGQKKKIKIIIDKDLDRGWYFYGGGHNSLANGQSYATLAEVQVAAERWIDDNCKTSKN